MLEETRNRLNWLKTIYPEFKEQEWMSSEVINESQILDYDFYELNNSYRGNINPKDIVGIDYAWEYNCMNTISWFDLLGQLKRFKWIMADFKTYDELCAHVSYNYKEGKYVSKYGDKLITTGGQHRLCLAKFLNINSVEVDVQEYKINKEKLSRFLYLKKHEEELSKWGLTFSDKKDMTDYTRAQYIPLQMENVRIRVKFELLECFFEYYNNMKYNLTTRLLCIVSPLEDAHYKTFDIEALEDMKTHKCLLFKHKFLIK